MHLKVGLKQRKPNHSLTQKAQRLMQPRRRTNILLLLRRQQEKISGGGGGSDDTVHLPLAFWAWL
jgi:hypothetical protein